MNTDTLTLLSVIGELVSAIAVVVSLIYLGIQVKQNTKAVRTGTLQNISENQLNLHSLIASNSDLADIIFKAGFGKENIQGLEKFRFSSWMHTIVRSLENAFYQHREGALDDRNWRALCAQYGPILKLKAHKNYWEERSFMYSEDFADFVNNELLVKPLPEGWNVPGS